jgi:hypothetical protein
MPLRGRLLSLAPRWGLAAAFLVCALVAPAAAQPRKGEKGDKGDAKGSAATPVAAPAAAKGDNKASDRKSGGQE